MLNSPSHFCCTLYVVFLLGPPPRMVQCDDQRLRHIHSAYVPFGIRGRPVGQPQQRTHLQRPLLRMSAKAGDETSRGKNPENGRRRASEEGDTPIQPGIVQQKLFNCCFDNSNKYRENYILIKFKTYFLYPRHTAPSNTLINFNYGFSTLTFRTLS